MRIPKYKYILAIIDFITIFISFFEARYFAILIKGKPILYDFPNLFGVSYSFIIIFLIFTLIHILIFQYNSLYKINIVFTKSAHLIRILKSTIYGIILLILTSFIFKLSYVIDSRSLVISVAFTNVLNLFIVRIGLIRLLFRKYSLYKPILRNTVIIGAGESGKLLAAKINFEELYGLKLIGFLDDQYSQGTSIISGIKNLGSIEELSSVKKIYMIDEFLISIDNITHENLLNLIEKCNSTGAIVELNSSLFSIIPKRFETGSYSEFPIIEVSPRMNNKFNLISKSVIDIILSFLGIIILSPFFMSIAILIKLSSKGSIFYKSVRIGKNGKPFIFYKFRTMEVRDEEVDEERKTMMLDFMKNYNTKDKGPTKIVNENRVTWIGRFLRKTSIDELPQLINVVKCEMSLVGPRPSLPYEYENYDAWQKRRVSVTPGCTGVWQVSGRSYVSFNDSVVLDLYYINHMSPWLDLQLILKTIPVMLFGRGGK